MLKTTKNCPAAIGTEQLVDYLHTLLQENSHNMKNLWNNENNENTLPVKFQTDQKRWKIAKVAMAFGQQVIQEHKDNAKVQRIAQQDVLKKALEMKQKKIQMLARIKKAATLVLPTRKRDDGSRVVDITPMKTRRVLQYNDAFDETETLAKKDCISLKKKLQREHDAGVSALTADELKEAKASLDYEDELRAEFGAGTTVDDLNESLQRVYAYMARQMILTHMTGLLQPDYNDFTSAKTKKQWGDHEGNLEQTKDRLKLGMQAMIGSHPKIENLHLYIVKTTKALEVLRWFCGIYKKKKRVEETMLDAQAQIALRIEQIFLAAGNVTPMLANANNDVKSGVLTKYEFYVNALESMARSRSELAAEGGKEAVKHISLKRGRGEADKESGEDQDPSGEEEGGHIRKMSLSKSQGAKLAAERQTTTKSSVLEQVFVPKKTNESESNSDSENENLAKTRSSAKGPKKGSSKRSSKVPKSDSLEEEDVLVDPSEQKSTPRKKVSVKKIKTTSEEEEEDSDLVLKETIRKVIAEQTGGASRSPAKEPCRLFAKGNCVYGKACKFSHDITARGLQPQSGSDQQPNRRPRGPRPFGQQHGQPQNQQPASGFYPGAMMPPGFAPPMFFPPPTGAQPPGVPPIAPLQLMPPAGAPPPLMIQYQPPQGVAANARPQGQVNVINPSSSVIRAGSLCDNLMRQGKCNYRNCTGSHGGWTPGARICRNEIERKPCPHQANGTCSFMHNLARGY